MGVKISVYDPDHALIKTINVEKEERYNKILRREKSILDLALDKDVPMNYGCMGGSCSACKCKVLKGQEFINREGVGKQIYNDVGEQEVLTCIATLKEDIPEDEEVEIEQGF